MVIEDTNLPDDKVHVVVSPTQIERSTETTGPTTQSTIWALWVATVGPHHLNSCQGLQRSNEYAGSDANRFARHICQVVYPI